MSQWPHDDWRSRAAFYGDPARGECEPQLVLVKPPFQMYYDGKPISSKGFRFHKKAAPALLEVLNDIWEQCDRSQAKIDKAGVSDFNGSYNHRKIRGRESDPNAWSNHAYGSAIDLNAKNNALGNAHGTMPDFVVKAFEDRGFKWGGRYAGRKDFMHFEAVDNGKKSSVMGLLAADVPDNGVDVEDVETPTETAVPETETVNSDGTIKRWWSKASTWVYGLSGFGGLGGIGSWFSGISPEVIGIVLFFAFAVFCVIWFTKKGKGW
jgi:hypothetical protein